MNQSLAIVAAISTIVLGAALVWHSIPALCLVFVRALAALGA